MNPSTIVVTVLVALVVLAIIGKSIYNKKTGKHSCSCGGDCASCGICPSSEKE